eukprot:65192_1
MSKFVPLWLLCPCCPHAADAKPHRWCHADNSCYKTTTINAKAQVSCKGSCHVTPFSQCSWKCNSAQHKEYKRYDPKFAKLSVIDTVLALSDALFETGLDSNDMAVLRSAIQALRTQLRSR